METSSQAGKVLWHCSMSLDGFVAGPGDSMDWMSGYAERPELMRKIVASVGAVLGGRRGWDLTPGDARPYGYGWEGPIFVLTHHPDDARTRDDVTLLDCDLSEAIRIGLEAADGKNLEILSADISRQAIVSGLLDEIYVHILPVLVGGGVRFFEQPGIEPIRWRRVEANTETEEIDLRFVPVR
jgi:dihydrofolate reductase